MNYRKWFYLLNAALMGAFVWAYAVDYNAEWKKYQKNYYRMAADELLAKAEKAKPEEAKSLKAEAKKLRATPIEIKQIIARDLGRYDRCITCHVGMDEYTNPTMTNSFTEHPYKAHPKLELFRAHPFQKFACTVCHEGQGLATTADAAHGRVHHWEKPLLEGQRVQGSCVKCHANFETLKGAEVAAKGKKIFDTIGCRGCHSINGVGGVVSVDLGDIADKPLERIAGFNFLRIKKKDGTTLSQEHHEWTLQNWVLGHLTNDPMEVVPNDPLAKFNPEPVAPSGMQDFRAELGWDGAEAVTSFLMGLTAEKLPHRYYVAMAPKPEPRFDSATAHGKFVFEKFGCAGCHGVHAVKGRRNFNALGPGQSDPEKDMAKGVEPTLPDTVGTYTHEELVKKIATGVPASAINRFNPKGPVTPLYMPSWKDKISPKEIDDLATWLLSIAKKDESGF